MARNLHQRQYRGEAPLFEIRLAWKVHLDLMGHDIIAPCGSHMVRPHRADSVSKEWQVGHSHPQRQIVTLDLLDSILSLFIHANVGQAKARKNA